MNQSAKDRGDPRTYAIIGACMEVHRVLGHGFLEAVYQEALEKELTLRNIPFTCGCQLQIRYKGMVLETYYKPDFICFDNLIIEIKALNKLSSIEEAQIINYLKATGFEVGLLINFGASSLQYKRSILTKDRQNEQPSG